MKLLAGFDAFDTGMQRVEPLPPARARTQFLWIALIFTVLFGLLFQYRILGLLKRLGVLDLEPIGSKFAIQFQSETASLWLRPFLYTAEYVNDVWFNTILGVLIAGAFAAFLPRLIASRLGGKGFRSALGGAALGLPNMLCSCCAVGATHGIRRAGAGLPATLSFFVAAPALNIVVIVLAIDKLPLTFALARAVLGIAAALGVSYLVARALGHSLEDALPAPQEGSQVQQGLLRAWLASSARTAVTVLPILFVGFFLVGVFKTFVPVEAIAKASPDGFLPTVVASLLGSLVMVPTGAEVMWVSEALPKGMGAGPAAALLICLPAVSLPSLWALGRVLNSWRIPVALFIGISALGLAAGTLASLIN